MSLKELEDFIYNRIQYNILSFDNTFNPFKVSDGLSVLFDSTKVGEINSKNIETKFEIKLLELGALKSIDYDRMVERLKEWGIGDAYVSITIYRVAQFSYWIAEIPQWLRIPQVEEQKPEPDNN